MARLGWTLGELQGEALNAVEWSGVAVDWFFLKKHDSRLVAARTLGTYVDDADGVGRLRSSNGCLACCCQALHLVHQDKDVLARVGKRLDVVKHLHHKLAALAEPFREQGVCVDFNKARARVRLVHPDCLTVIVSVGLIHHCNSICKEPGCMLLQERRKHCPA